MRRNGGVRSIVRPRTSIRRAGVTVHDRVHGPRALDEERLAELHHRVVVAVGLIGLEHRELGVVVAVDAFVAEVAPQLVHALDSPDEHALEIQLQRDAQLHRHVERVVVRRERTRVRAARDGLQHRPLELDEPALVEHAAHRLSTRRLAPGRTGAASSSAIRCRYRRRCCRSGSCSPCHFSGSGRSAFVSIAHRSAKTLISPLRVVPTRPVDADDVAEVDLVEQREQLGRQVCLARDDLQVARAVAEHEELQLADVPLQHDPAGDRDHVVGLRVGLEAGMRGSDLRGRRRFADPEGVLERESERRHARLAEAHHRVSAAGEDRRFTRATLLVGTLGPREVSGVTSSPIGRDHVLLEDEPESLEREPRLVAVDRRAMRDDHRREPTGRDRGRVRTARP